MDPKIKDQQPVPQSPGIGGERDLGIKESGPEVPVELTAELQDAGLEVQKELDRTPFRINTINTQPVSTVAKEPTTVLESYNLAEAEQQAKGDPKNGIVGRSLIVLRETAKKVFNRNF